MSTRISLGQLEHYPELLQRVFQVLQEHLLSDQVNPRDRWQAAGRSIGKILRLQTGIRVNPAALERTLAPFIPMACAREQLETIAYLIAGNVAWLRRQPAYKCTNLGKTLDVRTYVAVNAIQPTEDDFFVEFRALTGPHAGDALRWKMDRRGLLSFAVKIGYTKERGTLQYHEPVDLLGAVFVAGVNRTVRSCQLLNPRSTGLTRRYNRKQNLDPSGD